MPNPNKSIKTVRKMISSAVLRGADDMVRWSKSRHSAQRVEFFRSFQQPTARRCRRQPEPLAEPSTHEFSSPRLVPRWQQRRSERKLTVSLGRAATAGHPRSASYDSYMPDTSPESRRQLQSLDPAELDQHQLDRLNELLAKILPDNALLRGQVGQRPPPARIARRASRFTVHVQGRIARHARSGGLRRQPDLPARAVRALPPDLRHARPAAGRARHGRGLAVVDRLLALHSRCRRSHARRCRRDGFFVRTVHRLLERTRCDDRPRLPGGSRRRHELRSRGWSCCAPARRPSCFARPAMHCTWPRSRASVKSTSARSRCAC